jgi:DNA-binding MarR family transcriptional regulator
LDDIAIIEEAIELLPQIGRVAFTAAASDQTIGSLTIAQSKAVGHLYHHGEQSITEMACGMGVSLPAMSEMIDRLLDKGLVNRTVDPEDRRRQIVALTPKALAFAHLIHDVRRRQVRACLLYTSPSPRDRG